MAFELDPVLAADTVEVTRWPLCRVLLMNDANYPWLILVPQRPGVTEIHQLAAEDRAALAEEAAVAARVLQAAFGADKTNVAALGNVVAQLHVHVIARFRADAAWPRPVWGAVTPAPYTGASLYERLALLRSVLPTLSDQ